MDELPNRISLLETEQNMIVSRLSDPNLYKNNPEESIRLNQRFEEIENELMYCMTRWEELESIAKNQ